MKKKHWSVVRNIYEEGIRTGTATFEIEAPDYDLWNQNHLKHCRLLVEKNGNVLGWAALSAVSGRCVYGGVAEVSIYMAQKSRGQGLGQVLMKELIACSEKNGFWTLQSGIFPSNEASIKLHERVGFRHVGTREKIAQLNGVWHNNLIYERRSKIVGQ